jgi:hypothetical protein
MCWTHCFRNTGFTLHLLRGQCIANGIRSFGRLHLVSGNRSEFDVGCYGHSKSHFDYDVHGHRFEYGMWRFWFNDRNSHCNPRTNGSYS